MVFQNYLIIQEKQGSKIGQPMWLDIWLWRIKLNPKSLFMEAQLEIELESENKQKQFFLKL